MSNRPEMADVTHVRGIKVTDSINYLGVKLYCDKKNTIQAIKAKMQKYLGCLRGRIRTNSLDSTAIIYGAFYRSLMIYFLTPLAAAGAITE